MVEVKTLTVGGVEYRMKCSILTTESFERLTGKKYGHILSKYGKLQRKLNDMSTEEFEDYLVENILDIQIDALQLAYCMIREADPDFGMSMDAFLGSVDNLSSDELKGVLHMAASVFPRALHKRAEGSQTEG